jgi:muramoyltetrapeptide carboxypeptidase LdcA involved in peptidoglycan recycling
MPTLEPLDFSQPTNDLSNIAKMERAKLFPKNDYKTDNKYSSLNPNALADGDDKGKGTGGDLDVHNQSAGAIQDITERTSLIVVNEFKPTTPYTTPTA